MTAYEKIVALSSRSDEDLVYLTGSDMGAIIEIENIVCLAACSLDSHPGKSNWVEDNGGLPQYICEIARAIMRGGSPKSRAIAIAVGRVKRWASGTEGPDGRVNADTRAKAAAAVAQWEKMKAQAKAKRVAK